MDHRVKPGCEEALNSYRPAVLTDRLKSGSGGRSRQCPLSRAPLLPTDVAQHIGVNVQADIRQVVEMLGGDEPNDLADLAFRIVPRQPGKGLGRDLFLFR